MVNRPSPSVLALRLSLVSRLANDGTRGFALCSCLGWKKTSATQHQKSKVNDTRHVLPADLANGTVSPPHTALTRDEYTKLIIVNASRQAKSGAAREGVSLDVTSVANKSGWSEIYCGKRGHFQFDLEPRPWPVRYDFGR